MHKLSLREADDIARVRQSTLIGLNRDARQIPLNSVKIRAQYNGQYVSAFKGRGMEFDEARPYQPGDDIRAMDWRVTARTGKPHSKVFREERERPVLLWVDYRAPMFFGTQQHFKSVLAARVAALIAWSTAHRGDRLGGLIFSEDEHIELRPSRGKSASLHFIKQLANHSAWDRPHSQDGEHSAAEALARLQRVSKPGSLVFLISDFRQMNELAWSRLSLLSRHCDVVFIDIHDPLEQQLPPAGIYKITNGQSELSLNTFNRRQTEAYQQRYRQQQEKLRASCRKLGIHYIDLSTVDNELARLQQGLGLCASIRKQRNGGET